MTTTILDFIKSEISVGKDDFRVFRFITMV